MPLASFVAGYHHERVNGTGYHKGLRGDEIPLTVKIVNIADAYDAMSTDRSYREKLSKEEIRRELERQRNEQFDSCLFECKKASIWLSKYPLFHKPVRESREDNALISSVYSKNNRCSKAFPSIIPECR